MPSVSTHQGAVRVEAPPFTLFDFVSNLENDSKWRTEITKTRLHGALTLGTRATEESHLSQKLPAHILELQCTHWDPPHKVIWETVAESPYYLKSIREVRRITDQSCTFDYTITFDRSIVYKALGFKLPGFILAIGARRAMKKYLAQLQAHFRK